MPVHDWTRVKDGTFLAFHLKWISSIVDELNEHLLPNNYYAMGEQKLISVESDALIRSRHSNEPHGSFEPTNGRTRLAKPAIKPTAEADAEIYARKARAIAVREVETENLVAAIEIVTPGNKDAKSRFGKFLRKCTDYINSGIHLLVIDILPPGTNDPEGINAAIWDYAFGTYENGRDHKPLTIVSYEIDESTREYVKHLKVGEKLPKMPLFLEPAGCVNIPLEATYQREFDKFPAIFRTVLE